MKRLKIILILCTSLIFLQCSSNKFLDPLDILTGNTWKLSSLMGSGLDLNEFPGGIPSLSFLDGGRLAGFTGCNNLSGSFQLEESRIRLNPGAVTRKACPGNGEQRFLSALGDVSELKLSKDKLTLLRGAEELMTLIPSTN